MKLRAFIGCMLAFCGLSLPITGIANHLLAQEPLSLLKHVWMSAHNVLGILFVISAILHVVINRKVFFNHLKSSVPGHRISREAIFSITLVCLFLFLAIVHAFHID